METNKLMSRLGLNRERTREVLEQLKPYLFRSLTEEEQKTVREIAEPIAPQEWAVEFSNHGELKAINFPEGRRTIPDARDREPRTKEEKHLAKIHEGLNAFLNRDLSVGEIAEAREVAKRIEGVRKIDVGFHGPAGSPDDKGIIRGVVVSPEYTEVHGTHYIDTDRIRDTFWG